MKKELLTLYYKKENGEKYEIKVNDCLYSDKWDEKYYLFINDKFIKSYKYKMALYNYVRINYNVNLMI